LKVELVVEQSLPAECGLRHLQPVNSESSTTMKQSIRKPAVIGKAHAKSTINESLFSTHPEAALPLLAMIGQAQWSIEELLSKLSHQFIEQLLVLSAESVAGAKHPGRHAGAVGWHGTQRGVIALGHAKLRVHRPRLRDAAGEVAVPGYAALPPMARCRSGLPTSWCAT
jgi:hypothetical protein